MLGAGLRTRVAPGECNVVMRIYESDVAAGASIGDSPEVSRQVYAESPENAVARRIAWEVG